MLLAKKNRVGKGWEARSIGFIGLSTAHWATKNDRVGAWLWPTWVV